MGIKHLRPCGAMQPRGGGARGQGGRARGAGRARRARARARGRAQRGAGARAAARAAGAGACQLSHCSTATALHALCRQLCSGLLVCACMVPETLGPGQNRVRDTANSCCGWPDQLNTRLFGSVLTRLGYHRNMLPKRRRRRRRARGRPTSAAALAAQLRAATAERDAALRRVRELTAALDVSAAEGARARCAAHALTCGGCARPWVAHS